MFLGSIPQAMRKILNEIVSLWDCDNIHVGCSGNFTIERILAELEIENIYGCDVTIYSSCIGAFLSGQEFNLQLREDAKADLGWLEPYIKHAPDQVATLQLCTKFLDGMSPKGEWKANYYYDRLRQAYNNQWDALHQQTVGKVQALPFSLAAYYNGDVMEYIKTVPKEHGFITFPPFWAGGYESMWRKLDMVFKWDAPQYDIMGEDAIDLYLKDIVSHDHWIFGVPEILDDYKDNLVGLTQNTNLGMPHYIYASSGESRISLPRQGIKPCFIPRLGQNEEIGDTIQISQIHFHQFNALRCQYMNPMITPTDRGVTTFVVTVDGLLIGAFGLTASGGSQRKTKGAVYLVSDFPVAPSKYKRLSKLVLYAALSHEGRLISEQLASRRMRSVATTAFSQRPSSMKYRGIFSLYSRDEYEDRPYKYMLNYTAPFGNWSLAEGLAMWKRKYSQ